MAQLRDTVVAGSLRATDTLYTTTLQTTKISAPTASNGTTYGLGSNGQILKSNGSSIYWAADNDAGDTKVTQAAVGTAAGTHNVLLAATAGNTSVQTTTALKGALTYTPSNKTLAVGGPLTATTGTFSGALSATSGNITSGTFAANTAGSAERQVIVQSGAGKLYMYSQAAVDGSKGIIGTTAAGSNGTILAVNQSNQISSLATITASPTITGTLTLSKTTDASGTANNSPALIVGGGATAAHLELDANEIMAKTNGTSVAPLYINNDGGAVSIGTGGLTVNAATTTKTLVISDTTATAHIKFSRTGNPSYISIPDGETLIFLNGTSTSSTANVALGINKSNLYTTFGSNLGSATYYWGDIYAKGYIYTQGTNRYPLDIQMKNSANTLVAEIWYDQGNNTNVTSGKYCFRQFSPNSTADTSTSGFKETYSLPTVATGLTADKSYNIITTKNLTSITTVGTITSGVWNGGKVNGLTLKANATGFEISGGTTSKKLTVGADYKLAAACAKGVDTSIAAESTSINLPTSAAVASFVEGKGYTTNTGTVTSVRVQATSPVVSSVNTAATTTLNTTISLANGYGDTKNPYTEKAKNLFLAGPSSGNDAVPTFRAIAAADLPAATGSALGAVKTGDGISNSSGTISVAYGTAAKTAAQGNDSRFGKVSTTLATTTKAYLLGVSTAPTATAQNLAAVSDTGVYLDTTAGSLTVSGNLTGKKFTHTTITGTGTAGVAYNKTNNVNGKPALWKFNLSTATPAEGDMITITVPVAGHGSGVYVSTDNGTTYKPVSTNGTAALTTQFPVGTTITLVYDADGQTNTIYPIAGAAATQNVTGGCWRVLNYYSNTAPYGIRVYRQTTGYNADYPLLISRTLAGSIGTAGTNSSYTNNVYGIIWNDTTKVPTVNPSTGAVKAVSYNGLTLTSATTGFTIAGGTTSKTLTVSQNMTLKGGTVNHIAYFDAANSLTSHPTAYFYDVDKTDTSAGVNQLTLGNSDLWTKTSGKAGLLNLYSPGSYGTSISSAYNTTEWYTAMLQAKSGTIAYLDDVQQASRTIVVGPVEVSDLPYTLTNSSIKASHVVINSYFDNPYAQLDNWAVNTADGSLTVSGCIAGTTNMVLYLLEKP